MGKNRYRVAPEQKEELRRYAGANPEQFYYPRTIKGVYDVALNREEKLFWAYKHWINQLEVAERGSGLEAYFANQDLTLALPEGFQPENTVTLCCGGDLMAVDCLTVANTAHIFDEIRDFYFGADITTANLESIVYEKAPAGRSSIPGMPAKMNISKEMLERYVDKGRGINYFSMANNHCFDYGEEGLNATLDAVAATGCAHSGTNKSEEEQRQAFILERNGIRIAMLSYTCDTNGNPYEKPWQINEVRFNDEIPDLTLVEHQVEDAKKRQADAVIVHAHWGWEFELYPHKNVVEAAHSIASMGVDVIVGTHPHVAQPTEVYHYEKGGESKTCLIIYSLGDFVSYHPESVDSALTYVAGFRLSTGKTDGGTDQKMFVSDFRMMPVYIMAVPADEEEESFDCRLLPFRDVLADDPASPRYPLTEENRGNLPHLKEVWDRILTPERKGSFCNG